MTEFADALCARDFILAAVQRAETEGECSLARVAAHLTQQLAGFVLAAPRCGGLQRRIRAMAGN